MHDRHDAQDHGSLHTLACGLSTLDCLPVFFGPRSDWNICSTELGWEDGGTLLLALFHCLHKGDLGLGGTHNTRVSLGHDGSITEEQAELVDSFQKLFDTQLQSQ